jgi:hypothetical protein
MLNSLRKNPSRVLTFWSILLTLLSYPPNRAFAASSGRQVFNIADYGAKKDGAVPATDAFRHAIQAAHAAGGGTIYAPAGNYTSGPIEFFSNMTLDVDAGARIEFPVAPATPLQRHGVLGDVVVELRSVRPDVMKIFRPLQVVRRAARAVAAQSEVLRVLPVCGIGVVAQ